jgi:hypothetical protein
MAYRSERFAKPIYRNLLVNYCLKAVRCFESLDFSMSIRQGDLQA